MICGLLLFPSRWPSDRERSASQTLAELQIKTLQLMWLQGTFGAHMITRFRWLIYECTSKLSLIVNFPLYGFHDNSPKPGYVKMVSRWIWSKNRPESNMFLCFLLKWKTLIISVMCQVVPIECITSEKQLSVQVQEDDSLSTFRWEPSTVRKF